MKKLLWIPLALLLLAGCSKEQSPQPTTAPTQPTTATVTTKPTEPGLYAPDSAIEKETSGAVRSYALETGEWFGLSTVGADVLVTGKDAMVLLTGEQGWATKAEVKNLSADTEIDTYTTGVAYYDAESRTVTLLNKQLQKVTQKVLPEDIIGAPVISMIRNEAYYFNGTEIRAMELNGDVSRSRLLRQVVGMDALLPDDYFDGNVLSCQLKDAAGAVRTEYFSSETGQPYSQDQGIDKMYTFNDRYYIERVDIKVQQRIFGVRSGERQSFLLTPGENTTLAPVLEMDGIVSSEETENGLDLSFYNLKTGKRTAQVLLSGINGMQAIHSNGAYVWILAREGEKQVLLRWDLAKTPATDENIYIGTFYSPDNPDKDGLEECVKLADTFEGTYKVKVHVGENAAKVTGDYTVVTEHQPQLIRTSLEELQSLLEELQPVLAALAGKGKTIQIGLVRRIESGEAWVRFQQNKTWWILISADADMAAALFEGLAQPIESHVIGNSRDYDYDRWNPLNPADFVYINGGNIEPNPDYLEGDTRAFVNAAAMNSISEDRRSIISNAMLADNAEMFESPVMQAKLQRICLGIREAYNLQKSDKIYLWEQYLTTSLAYVK